MIQFAFIATKGGVVIDKEIQSVICDNVLKRGSVPVPPVWKASLGASLAPLIAEAACEQARRKERHLEIQCRVLGAAKAMHTACMLHWERKNRYHCTYV